MRIRKMGSVDRQTFPSFTRLTLFQRETETFLSNNPSFRGPVIEVTFSSMPTTDKNDAHERFTHLLLESEPVMLRSILVSVPHRTDAREILQETAVALWRQFENYDPERPFLNWAMGFARIETRRFLSRESRRAQLSEKAMEALKQEMQGSQEFDSALKRHLATCLGKLSEKAQRQVKGYYLEDHTPQTLSQREGRTVEAVYKTIQRARRELQACIERQIKSELA
jgi:RNA polymerase sigma-70 factor (ECF subfamily)